MSNKTTLRITRTALIAGIYVALTYVLMPLSYGPMQFRISEALTLLPIIIPEAVIGLTVGCLLANIISMYGAFDMILGTLATALAAISTYLLRRKIVLAGIPPVVFNALIVPIIFILNGEGATLALYLFNAMTIFVSQAVVVYALGIPLTIGLRKTLPLQYTAPSEDEREDN